MKQTSYLIAALFALCLALAAPTAFAQDSGSTDQKIMTIQEVRDNAANGDKVTIQAQITKGLGAGKVALEDPTGPIKAKIDKSLWPDGKPAGDGALITITGTLVKRGNLVEIQAEAVTVDK